MGIARHFDGNDDYLFTPSSSESYTGMTCAAWVIRDGIGTRNAIMGRLYDYHNGWVFFVDEADFLSFFATGSPVDDPSQLATVVCPDLSVWTFIAVTYNSAAASPQVRFYAGTTADTIVEIGTHTRTGGFGELGTYPIAIGNVFNGNVFGYGSVTSWNGSLDQIGIWYGALTLEQLKEAAICGSRVLEGECKLIADISGDDPEPCIQVGTAQVLTLGGTTVVEGVGVGCDQVAVAPLVGSQLITCM